MKFPGLFVVMLLTAASALPVSALVNGQAPDEDDTRFDAVAAFSRYNWLIEDEKDNHKHNWFGNAVLISPDVVLYAKHLLPKSGDVPNRPGVFAVRFRRHAEGALGAKSQGPESYHQVQIERWIVSDKFDLAFGILREPVEHIEPVKMYLQDGDLAERKALLAGWGSESPWRGQSGPRNGLRVGENTVTSRSAFLMINSNKTELRENDKGQRTAYYVDKNATVNMHDSGGSIFVYDDDGTPLLAGIIATYSGGAYLPAAAAAGFPLEAASKGSEALLAAIDEQE